MKVLILGLNYAPEPIGIAVYTTGTAEFLVSQGHEVQVIAGQPYYPDWRVHDGYSRLRHTRHIEKGVDITRAPHYVPSNPTGARRILHHISFAVSALFPALIRAVTWQPDVVLAIAPSLIAAPVGRMAALVAGAPSWLHVQDFEVETAFATGLLNQRSILARLSGWFEQTTLLSFHAVSTISPEMLGKLVAKGLPPDRLHQFRNWADIEAVRPLGRPSSFRQEWGIATPHVALYSGNIGAKQGVEIIIEAARALSHRQDMTFVICGEGPNRPRLEALGAGLSNIQFHDLQPPAKLSELLGLATIHLLPQLPDTADLVLPSKLTNMLASGRPVVATSVTGTGLAREIEHCGLLSAPGDPRAFADAIARLADDPDLHRSASASARRQAEERWANNQVLHAFERGLVDLVAECGPSPALVRRS